MERIGSSLYETLMRNGVRARTVGAVEAHGKGAGCTGGNMHPATALQREENCTPMGMTISRDRLGGRPQLMVIEGGKR